MTNYHVSVPEDYSGKTFCTLECKKTKKNDVCHESNEETITKSQKKMLTAFSIIGTGLCLIQSFWNVFVSVFAKKNGASDVLFKASKDDIENLKNLMKNPEQLDKAVKNLDNPENALEHPLENLENEK